uniref:Uncharacterized protein n=1 Tax=Parascaris equorum TaxID=6256 RepID=A0A914SC78_PAREQ
MLRNKIIETIDDNGNEFDITDGYFHLFLLEKRPKNSLLKHISKSRYVTRQFQRNARERKNLKKLSRFAHLPRSVKQKRQMR